MSHRVAEEWMGTTVETLADLIPHNPRIICVGINPSPISVAAGHYYQGQLGRRFFSRLRQVGLLPPDLVGWENDAAYSLGIGFTDVVKRSTGSSVEVDAAELRHGATILAAKLETWGAPLVVFVFKGAAGQVLGRLKGNGFVPGVRAWAERGVRHAGSVRAQRPSR
jgi:TDG/mug DNA glycosylase family protein